MDQADCSLIMISLSDVFDCTRLLDGTIMCSTLLEVRGQSAKEQYQGEMIDLVSMNTWHSFTASRSCVSWRGKKPLSLSFSPSPSLIPSFSLFSPSLLALSYSPSLHLCHSSVHQFTHQLRRFLCLHIKIFLERMPLSPSMAEHLAKPHPPHRYIQSYIVHSVTQYTCFM